MRVNKAMKPVSMPLLILGPCLHRKESLNDSVDSFEASISTILIFSRKDFAEVFFFAEMQTFKCNAGSNHLSFNFNASALLKNFASFETFSEKNRHFDAKKVIELFGLLKESVFFAVFNVVPLRQGTLACTMEIHF